MPTLTPDRHRSSGDVHRFVHGCDDALGQHGRILVAGDAALDDGELVAAEAAYRVDLARTGFEPFSGLAQQLVTGWVTQGIVDLLEAVEVEAQHGEALTAAEALQRLVNPLSEEHAVG